MSSTPEQVREFIQMVKQRIRSIREEALLDGTAVGVPVEESDEFKNKLDPNDKPFEIENEVTLPIHQESNMTPLKAPLSHASDTTLSEAVRALLLHHPELIDHPDKVEPLIKQHPELMTPSEEDDTAKNSQRL